MGDKREKVLVDRNSTFSSASASFQEKFKSTFTEVKQTEVNDDLKEETKTKRYSDKRKEERLRREKEKAEKTKRKDDIIDIEDDMTDDASVRDDVSATDDISVKSDSKSVLEKRKGEKRNANIEEDIKSRQ